PSLDCSLLSLPDALPISDASDFSLGTQTLLRDGQSTTYSLSIPITDDNEAEQQAEYFVLALRKPVNYAIKGDTLATIYIRDNDRDRKSTRLNSSHVKTSY